MPDEELLSDEESLFKSPGILEIEYLPRLLPYREEQQRYLAGSIKKLPSLGTSVLIHGPSGIGKTASIRWVFRELVESEESDVFPVYINCWQDSDLQKIILRICDRLGISISYRSPDELRDIAMKTLSAKKAVVLAFDEIDRMQDQSFLYHFIEELPHKSIFMISTRRDWLAHLDSRVRSRLMPEVMEITPYDTEQTRGILKERKDHAFVPGVWESDAFEMVVSSTFEKGDIRTGLAILKASGLEAEREASRRITTEHVSKAIGKLGMEPEKPAAPKEKRISDFS